MFSLREPYVPSIVRVGAMSVDHQRTRCGYTAPVCCIDGDTYEDGTGHSWLYETEIISGISRAVAKFGTSTPWFHEGDDCATRCAVSKWIDDYVSMTLGTGEHSPSGHIPAKPRPDLPYGVDPDSGHVHYGMPTGGGGTSTGPIGGDGTSTGPTGESASPSAASASTSGSNVALVLLGLIGAGVVAWKLLL